MTRTEMKQILDKVLDMGESPLHYAAVDFNTDTEAIFCSIYIHLNAPAHLEHSRDVCNSISVFRQTDDVQPVLNWLDVWAKIFEKERELDETDGR